MAALTDAGWLRLLVESYEGGDRELELDLMVECGAERLRLCLRGGRFEPANPDQDRKPDLTIRSSRVSLRNLMLGKAACTDLLGELEVEIGGRRYPAAPAAELALPQARAFEKIPGCSLVALINVSGSILGEVAIREIWRDGALVESAPVATSELNRAAPDVVMSCTLGQLVAIRRRELTPLDALAQGVGLIGDWPQLMCFTELMQHRAYLAPWEGDCSVPAQVAWGGVFCSQQYGDAALRALLGTAAS